MVRSVLLVAFGILMGLLIVWMVMSQAPSQQPPPDRYRMPGSVPAGK